MSDARAVAYLFVACFAEAPWFERFDVSEMEAEFVEMARGHNSVIMVADADGQVVGCSAGFPMVEKADVMELIEGGAAQAFYLAELFVNSQYRRQGIARKLVNARGERAVELGYTEAVVRTSEDQTIIRKLYAGLGFQIVATQDVESLKFIDGIEVMVPDRRVILKGSL
ncbi:GNAT family N-acetyltransferase [Candidatus Uhrbacteria bacterium]|nr:GNAT family N-acetyltransferase [Candidatus Uhrbacteria bacterium]